MKLLNKVVSVVLAGVMAVTGMGISASAKSLDELGKTIKSGKQVSVTMKPNAKKDVEKYYKFEVTQRGEINLDFTTKVSSLYVTMYTPKGDAINPNNTNVVKAYPDIGYILSSAGSEGFECMWKTTLEKCVGTIVYNADITGTYYLKYVVKPGSEGTGKVAFTVTAPGSSTTKTTTTPTAATTTSKNTATIQYLSMSLPVGMVAQLAGVLNKTSTESIVWATSDSKVVSITKRGKITTNTKGSALITATLGTQTVKIKIHTY